MKPNMKKTLLALLICPFLQIAQAQVSGNVNQQSQVRFPDQNINVSFPTGSDLLISVKGLANVKADAYVAVFSAAQSGKTAQEAHGLLEQRLAQALAEIRAQGGAEAYVDMVTFVPVYEFDAEKKAFSKTTYNEIPAGFELKKNIHLQYSDPGRLDDFMVILARHEVYDLVRVDYFSGELESVKKELMSRAKAVLLEKMAHYESLLGEPLATADKKIADGYRMALPVEMYRSYEAYNSSPLNAKKSAQVTQAAKSATLYYQPIVDKEFDFVLNPVVLEPVIQVLYEIKMSITREEKPVAAGSKEYLLITPAGELKKLDLNSQ